MELKDCIRQQKWFKMNSPAVMILPKNGKTMCIAALCALIFCGGCVTPPRLVPAVEVTRSDPPPQNLTFTLPGEGGELRMIGIGRGTFVMGEQIPVFLSVFPTGHKVTLSKPFWIGQYELTCRQYTAITNRLPSHRLTVKYMLPEIPVILTREEALFLLQRLNELFRKQLPKGYSFNLPTEAQWEYACRAGTTNSLNNDLPVSGNLKEYTLKNGRKHTLLIPATHCPNLDKVGWYAFNRNKIGPNRVGPGPVGRKLPNRWGLYDMHGNAAEMCLDRYHYGYEQRKVDYISRLNVTLSFAKNKIDPVNKNSVGSRGYVSRGGNVFSDVFSCTSCARGLMKNDGYCGIRVALTQELPEQDDSDMRIFGSTLLQDDFANKMADIENRYRERMTWLIIDSSIRIGAVVVDTAAQVDSMRKGKKRMQLSGNGQSVSGNGRIHGPDSLHVGQIGTYHLYVGGKKILGNVEWRASGTSITVNGSSEGRVMARRPPRIPFKTYFEAKYGGRTFRKSITIK